MKSQPEQNTRLTALYRKQAKTWHRSNIASSSTFGKEKAFPPPLTAMNSLHQMGNVAHPGKHGK